MMLHIKNQLLITLERSHLDQVKFTIYKGENC